MKEISRAMPGADSQINSSKKILGGISGANNRKNLLMKSPEDFLEEISRGSPGRIPGGIAIGNPLKNTLRNSWRRGEFLDKSPDEFLEQIDRGQQPLEEFLGEISAEIPERNHRINS